VEAVGGETLAGEVVPVKAGEQEDGDDEQDDRQLPPDGDVVDSGEPAHTVVVDDDEDRHCEHRDDISQARQRVHRLAADIVGIGEGRVLGGVLESSFDLDGRDRGCRDPVDPPQCVAGERPERQVGKADDAAGQREHRAEFGEAQGDQQDHHGTDGPREDRCRAGDRRRVEGSEEPSRPDDRPDACEQQTDDADVPAHTRAGIRGGG